jgi:hypothetical protein
MGYYSNFEVFETDIDNIEDVLNTVLEDTGHPGWETWGDGIVHGTDCTKWYDWIQDLQLVADAYPDKHLVIERTGEESPDISRAVIKLGTVTEYEPRLVWDYLES